MAADEPVGRHAYDFEPEHGTERAVDGPPSTVNGLPAAPPGPPASGSWEESNKRVTFYCPSDLIDQVEDEGARSGRSKSRVIVDAIRAHLNAPA